MEFRKDGENRKKKREKKTERNPLDTRNRSTRVCDRSHILEKGHFCSPQQF